MRRSAAPSQLYAKRPRFNPPSIQSNVPGPGNSDKPTSTNGTRTKADVMKLVIASNPPGNLRPENSNVSDQPQDGDKNTRKVSVGITTAEKKSCNLVNENKIPGKGKGHFLVPRVRGSGDAILKSKQDETRPEREDLNMDIQPAADTSSDVQKDITSCKLVDQGRPKDFNRAIIPGRGFKTPSAARALGEHNSGPLTQPRNVNSLSKTEDCDEPKTFFYNIVWCKRSNKKHKKWEGDAILKAKGRSVTLFDTEGKEIGRGSGYKVNELASMSEGQTLLVGGKEIEVMSILKEEDFESGRCFQTAVLVNNQVESSRPKSIAPAKPFVKPQLLGTQTQVKVQTPVNVLPKFDPTAPDALVMPRPSHSLQMENKGQQIVDVVVDPHVAYHLRPHQRAGVIFLYECVMGMKNYNGHGAILADEMGLGKTLQCISLIWTLYKQGPYNGKPVLRRVLVITPGSLVKNWVREFRKWLGNERLKVYAVNAEQKAEAFIHSTVFPVMIISYEMFIRNFEAVQGVKFDLVVCDEGHRLKNTNIKTTSFMMNLSTRRRIVLTGTPVQNDLKELYSIVEFANPGVLGTSSAFHHVYEAPILASRQPSASPKEVTLGETRAQELNRVTGMFIIRRTQDLNNKYLPPKVEVVLFCQPTSLQLKLYQRLLSSKQVRSCLSGGLSGESAQHLMCIAALKKLCNCPSLLYGSASEAERKRNMDSDSDESELYSYMLDIYPPDYNPSQLIPENSGKLIVLDKILKAAHQITPRQKVVLVSNYTQTLDVLELVCKSYDYSFLRLDGQTPTTKRQQLVERFNSKHSTDFVFLLSSKAGGVGLNLIGASRLILYDIDWNPANDLQAMARIWRDGQTHTVYIYRLITTGSIEEKMYQRQVSKQGLSGVVVDAKANSKHQFSPDELKDLFKLPGDSLCATHDLLTCDCDMNDGCSDRSGSGAAKPVPFDNIKKNVCMDELMDWNHEKGPGPHLDHVDPLLCAGTIQNITYAFWNSSGGQPPN